MCLTSFERIIALRYLRSRKSDSIISAIAMFSLAGIALGVMTLIVVLSVMRGVRGEMINSIIGLEGHVTVVANGNAGLPDFDTLARKISTLDGVAHALPIVQGQVLLSANGQANGVLATGIRAIDLQYKPLITNKIAAGNLEDFKAGKGIMIGSRMAERMNVQVGDSVTLISPEGRATPAGRVPRIQAYPVVATFSIGMFAYDNGMVLMPFETAQTFFMLRAGEEEGRASAVEVVGSNADMAPALAQRIANMGQGYLRSYDWKSSNNHLFNAVMVQRNVMFLILTLIIVVASFNIISSLIMLVRQKRRDIAILRTMGASRKNILHIFMTTGCLIGMMGTVLGVVFGLLIAFNTQNIQAFIERVSGQKLLADELYFLSSLPSEVSLAEVGMVAGMAMVLCFVATWFPARTAAKLEPAEVLRGE
jgi:lipoprotein-releasing system permease protein